MALTRAQLAATKRAYDATKHPRDGKGRFATTNTGAPSNPYAVRPEVVAILSKKLSKSQRQAAIAALSEAHDPRLKPTLQRILPPLKNKLVDREQVSFHEHGIEIWQHSPNKQKDPTFHARVNKHYNYEVQVDGKAVSLNRNRNEFEFQGEKVRGVPSLHPHLREMTTQDIFRALVSTMTLAETSAPRIPQWDSGLHGQTQGVNKWQYNLGGAKGKADNYYGGMQIHHVGQWAKLDIVDYNEKVRSGALSREESQKIFDANFTKRGASYEINVKPPGDREFVMLPAGVHDFNSTLFHANHPRPLNPTPNKKGQLVTAQIGIPHTGKDAASGSREWFNKWQDGFWREVYRRESFVLRQEINRRIENKSLPLSEAKKLWDSAHTDALK